MPPRILPFLFVLLFECHLETMQRLGTVAKPLLLEFRNAWSRQIRALYSLQFMTKCPKKLILLAVTLLLAACTPNPCTVANLRHSNSG